MILYSSLPLKALLLTELQPALNSILHYTTCFLCRYSLLNLTLSYVPDLIFFFVCAFQFDFDFVQVYRVREFQFRPLEEEFEFETGEVNCRQHLFRSGSRSSQNSVWNCDGEVIGTPGVHVK